MYDLENSNMSKDILNMQDKPMAFNVTEHKKFINMVCDSTLQLIILKTPLVEFWCSIKKNITIF